MPRRAYVSSVRTAAAAEKRDRVLKAAAKALRQDASIAHFSLDSVAKAAGVTRLTVYNQFGSRRGLLEAVFDEIARQGGLHRIADTMAMADPRDALDRLVEIFCAFWNKDPAVGRLHDAMATDPEFAEAVLERNERRRKASPRWSNASPARPPHAGRGRTRSTRSSRSPATRCLRCSVRVARQRRFAVWCNRFAAQRSSRCHPAASKGPSRS